MKKTYTLKQNEHNNNWVCSMQVLRNGKPFMISYQDTRKPNEKKTSLEKRLYNKLLESINRYGYTIIEPKGDK